MSPGSGPYDEIMPEQSGGHQNPAYESLDPPNDSSYVNVPQPSPYTALNPIQNPKSGSVGKLDHRERNPVQMWMLVNISTPQDLLTMSLWIILK